MKETDIAYCAGLIDGEGCIRIKKTQAYKCQDRRTPGYHANIHVRMVDEAAIKFLAETLGGWYYKEKPHTTKGRPLYCWQSSDKRADYILRTVLPYLRVKKAVAEVVLRLRDLQSKSKEHKTKIIGCRNFPNAHGKERQVAITCFSDEYVQMCEDLFQQSKSLNAVGIQE